MGLSKKEDIRILKKLYAYGEERGYITGMCNNLRKLYHNEDITLRQLKAFNLHKYAPEPMLYAQYWWRMGDKEPRQAFLHNLIEELTKGAGKGKVE
jgi:hypothetical protein